MSECKILTNCEDCGCSLGTTIKIKNPQIVITTIDDQIVIAGWGAWHKKCYEELERKLKKGKMKNCTNCKKYETCSVYTTGNSLDIDESKITPPEIFVCGAWK